MIPKTLRPLINYINIWLTIAMLTLLFISLITAASDTSIHAKSYIIILYAFIAVSLIQYSLMPLAMSALAIPIKSVALLNIGMLLLFSAVGLIPVFFIRLIAHGDLGASLPEIGATLLQAFAMALILLRFSILNPISQIWFAFYVPMTITRNNFDLYLLKVSERWWPLFLLIIVVAIMELPHFLKSLYKDPKHSQCQFSIHEIYGPKGPHPLTQLRGALIWAFILIYAAAQIPDIPYEFKTNKVFRVTLMALIMTYVYVFTIQRRAALASGLSRLKATLYAITAIFGVGYCYRFSFGVRDGKPVRCLHCGNWCMIWMRQCPHCIGKLEEVRPIPDANQFKAEAIRVLTSDILKGDQLASTYRIGMVVILAVIWWFNFLNSK